MPFFRNFAATQAQEINVVSLIKEFSANDQVSLVSTFQYEAIVHRARQLTSSSGSERADEHYASQHRVHEHQLHSPTQLTTYARSI